MSTLSTVQHWRDVRRVHRLEYPFPISYLCHGLWGAAFAVAAAARLLDPPVLIAVLASTIPIVTQNVLNGGQDIGSDAVHPGKRDIAAAAARLGLPWTLRWSAVEFGLAIVLAGIVTLWVGRPLVVLAVAVAVGLHLLYNLEPVKLKRRAFGNPFYFVLTFAVLPCLSGFAAARADLPMWALLTFAGLGTLLAGRSMWWSVPDREADAAAGNRTIVVRIGAHRATLTACLVTVAGIALLGAGIWWHLGPAWSLVVVVATGIFLVDKLLRLARISNDRLPTERRVRVHSLPLAVMGDVIVVLVPLVAARS